jgi:KUP system potassium uptake protein
MQPHDSTAHPNRKATPALVLGALGVVFGDIGTSPLYTFQECLHHLSITQANIYGVVSLLFWSLTLVVTFKYVALLMNADNRGEGGIMALLTLLPRSFRSAPGGQVGLVSLLVIGGAALLFGDGVITPAISVLSAMEGLGVANDDLKPYIVPATVGILIALFAIQRRGTGALGAYFGPIMVLLFLCIGALGVKSISLYPGIFAALSPTVFPAAVGAGGGAGEPGGSLRGW